MTLPQPMPFFSAAAAFMAGSDTPRAFLERCLDRLEAFEPAVGAFVCHDIAAARLAADNATARWRDGRKLSLIDGMPLGIKDIIETADMPTGQGSPLFVDCRTGRDEASVAALREAGCMARLRKNPLHRGGLVWLRFLPGPPDRNAPAA